MKIIKKGTFDKQGMPTEWHIDMNEQENVEYALGVIKEKVCVNGIEIVEWTQERDKCMEEETK